MIHRFSSLGMLLWPCCVWAQAPADLAADTAVLLPPAEVVAEPIRTYAPGSRIERWSAETLEPFSNGHLGNLLEQASGIFIKTYGIGSSATSSIRGAGAGHTTVLWNGIPLQSPMLGQLDFSLLPLAFTDQVELQYGGNTAAWGSGAIGGVIALKNALDFSQKNFLSFQSTLGSFGFFEPQLQTQYGSGKWRGKTRLFYRSAINDFAFQLAPHLPEQRQEHARLEQSGILQEVSWRPTSRQELTLRLWSQQSDREIPPTTVQTRSEARQEDAFLRTALHWKSVTDRFVWQARAAFFHEKLHYFDDQILLESRSRYQVGLAEIEGFWPMNARQRLQVGLTHTWTQAQADAYAGNPQQNRSAAFAVFRQQIATWQFQANLRQERIDDRWAPLVPALGLTGHLSPWLQLHAKVSRNYRLPSLNDLYWQPGGNPDLRPENGWSQEVTLEADILRHKHPGSASITAFNRQIRDWILWIPLEGQVFWSPQNIAQVWSRGLEHRVRWETKAFDWRLELSGGYDFILSTNQVALDNPRIARGEQLYYTPRHQAFGSLAIRRESLRLQYRHRYTGAVRGLNVSELDAYQVGNLTLAYATRVAGGNARLGFHLHNVWDADYRVVERRPMPGRHFAVSVFWGKER